MKAEKSIRNLAKRLEQEARGMSALACPPNGAGRSLACTNIIENMNGTVRRVCRTVKHWQDVSMASRWTGAATQEASKRLRRLKAYRQLPLLKAALAAHQAKHAVEPDLDTHAVAA